MHKKYMSVVASVMFMTASVAFATPMNLSCAKRAVVTYYDSGAFEKEVNIVVKDAEVYLQKRVEENRQSLSPKKLAMVLDIDDTSLSNFQSNKQHDFGSSKESIEQSYRQANAPAIQPVLRLFNEAVRSGVDVFFITFRPDEFRSYTITNLQKIGYYGWTNLYMPNIDEINLPAQQYKTALRKQLTEQGYTIILSVGDQDSDLNGGYVEHVDKIPNPLYSTAPTCPGKTCKGSFRAVP